MKNRKLDSKRLYKVTRVLVVIITLIFVLKLAFNDYYSEDRLRAAYQLELDKCSSIYDPDTLGYKKCKPDADNIFYTTAPTQWEDIILIVSLPALFFGGGWIYKYLFPTEKNEK